MFTAYHVYLVAALEYFGVTVEQRRAYMFNNAPMPSAYAISSKCIYHATESGCFPFISSLHDVLLRDSAYRVNCGYNAYTHLDFVKAADYLCKAGLHEQQMVCMQLAHELAPSETEPLCL